MSRDEWTDRTGWMDGWVDGMSISGLYRPANSERLMDKKKLEGAGRT